MASVNLKNTIRSAKVVLVISIFCVSIYSISYFAVSDIFVGEFSGETMRIRLFQRKFDLRFYRPMIYFETQLRQGPFYAQVRSGASLPPGAR